MSAPLLPSEVLSKAADLIEPEGAWQKDEWSNSTKTCFCAEGAIAMVAECWPANVFTRPEAAFLALATGEDDIPRWNDHPKRTQAEVIAGLRAAAELAKAQGQ